MAIPDAVLEQEARVNKMMEELNTPPPASGDETTPPAETEPNQPAEDTPPQPTEPAQQDPEDASLKAKYDTLSGKYNVELARLNSALSELRLENAELRSRTAEVMASYHAPKPSATKSDPEPVPDEVKKLQEDLPEAFKTMAYLAKKEVKAELGNLDGKFKEVEQRITSTTQESFFDRLDGRVADWEVINKQPDFLNWLQTPEGYSGKTYHDLLQNAVDSRDLERTAKFFNDFKKSRETPPTQPTPPKQEPKTNKFTAPPKGAGAQPPKPAPEVETVTTSFIKNFGNEIAQGKWKGKEAEVEAINKKINIALAAGKVIRDT